jgi:hypothetical protein
MLHQQHDTEVSISGQKFSPLRLPAIGPDNLPGVAKAMVIEFKGLGFS